MTGLAKMDAAPANLAEVMKLSDMLAKAGGGFIPTHLKNAGQVAAVVLAGAELGIGPMAAMRGLTLIQGKVVLDASLIGALMRKAGVRMTWTVSTDTTATLHCERDGLTHDETFSLEDAKRAGLTNKDNWRNWPKAMLRARATSSAARAFCPEVFFGAIYTEDEIPQPAAPASKPTLASITEAHKPTAASQPIDVPAEPVDPPDGREPSEEEKAEIAAVDRLAELENITDADALAIWCEEHGSWYRGLDKESDARKAINRGLTAAARRTGSEKETVAKWIAKGDPD